MFKRMKLAAKIGTGFGLLIAIACALGLLAVYNMKAVEGNSTMLAYEYVPEVRLANEVERDSLMAMYAIRGYGYSYEDEYLTEGRSQLAELKKRLDECQQLADESTHLTKLNEDVVTCKQNAQAYEKLVEETVRGVAKIEEDRQGLDHGAAQYMQACNHFLTGQNEKAEEELRAGANAEQLRERLAKITLVNNIIDLGNATRIACFKSQALRDPKLIQDAMANFQEMDKEFASLREITRLPEDIARIDETKAAADEYKKCMQDLLTNWLALEDLGRQRTQVGDAVLKGAQDTAMAGIKHTDEIATSAAQSLSTSSTVMLVGLATAIAIGIALAVFITRSIVKPIRRIIDNLNEGSEQVSAASGQVSAASQSLAEGATEQAAGLEETSSSLEEMSSMTKQNADNAQQANTLATEARRSAGTGAESMGRMNQAIQDIQKSSDETAKIIKVIDEIAFQTNLLALNAAVEAARAGEAGKGFAVVAEEVRNLAMRSAEAAKNTASMIEESVKNSKNGVDIAGEVGKVLDEIVQSIGKTTDLVSEIAAASQEQAQGIDQVNTAVAQMDKVTQQNAANAEESASASEELSAQAESMKEVVSELVALVGGANAQTTASEASKTRRPRLQFNMERRLSGVVKSGSQSHSFGKSDEAFHKIAVRPQKTVQAAHEAIPLDDDLSDFNS